MRIVRTVGLAALVCAARVFAQAPELPCGAVKTQALPPCDKPAAPTVDAALARAASAPPAPDALATLDGVAFRLADLGPEVGKKVEGVDTAVAAARRQALEAEVADVRLHLEAGRRGESFRDYWEREVLHKTPPASEADMKPIFERWKGRNPGKTFADLRPRMENMLLFRNREKREAELAGSLKERFPSTPGADPAAPGLVRDAVLATVGGRRITAESAATRLDAAGYGVRRDVYFEEREAVEKAVTDHLAKAEADRRGMTPAALRKAEIDDKVVLPTSEEIARAYEKANGAGRTPTEEERKAIAEDLRMERADKLETAFEKGLREGHAVDVRAPEPPPPALTLDLEGAPSRGPANAPVTLVEYLDFECPHCAHGFEHAEELVRTYGERVRYVVRNFPLPFHEHALKAAEAGRAAHVQGRFFEIANLMFRHQDTLDTSSLKAYASEAGCDRGRFAADLDGGRHAAATLLEIRNAQRAGVAWTPSFFVNGVPVLWDGTIASLRKPVDAALARAAGASIRPASTPPVP